MKPQEQRGDAVIILIGLLIFVILGFLIFATLYSGTTGEIREAVVLDRVYSAARTGTSVGPVVGGRGGVAVSTVYVSESWVLIVRDTQNTVFHVDVDAGFWAEHPAGSRLHAQCNWAGCRVTS